MNQLSMFSEIPDRVTWLKEEIVFSLSFDQTKILRDIMRLYLEGQAFDADVTYSKGVFWKKLPQPRLKFDIAPQFPDVIEASAHDLPLDNDGLSSIIFDPPFIPSKSNVPGVIKKRFSSFKSPTEMWGFYRLAMREFWRVLRPGGILVVKCQDTVSSGKNLISHFEIELDAREIGYETLDLFILGSRNVLMSPNMKTQQHARKNHSFLFVFKKPE